MKITLQDFEIRYKNIRLANPKIRQCSVTNCSNPCDITPLLGEDSSCAYHRLLFDFWLYEVMDNDKSHHYFTHQKGRRRAVTNWRNRIGSIKCNDIVLRMAQEGINWEC